LLGAVPFSSDVPRLKQLGVRGVVTLNEPYETLVPTSLYQVDVLLPLVAAGVTLFLYDLMMLLLDQENYRLYCNLISMYIVNLMTL
jgi:atypical dual specificity phosphatase